MFLLMMKEGDKYVMLIVEGDNVIILSICVKWLVR